MLFHPNLKWRLTYLWSNQTRQRIVLSSAYNQSRRVAAEGSNTHYQTPGHDCECPLINDRPVQINHQSDQCLIGLLAAIADQLNHLIFMHWRSTSVPWSTIYQYCHRTTETFQRSDSFRSQNASYLIIRSVVPALSWKIESCKSSVHMWNILSVNQTAKPSNQLIKIIIRF